MEHETHKSAAATDAVSLMAYLAIGLLVTVMCSSVPAASTRMCSAQAALAYQSVAIPMEERSAAAGMQPYAPRLDTSDAEWLCVLRNHLQATPQMLAIPPPMTA